jgi:hypothetical protein
MKQNGEHAESDLDISNNDNVGIVVLQNAEETGQ